MPSTSDHGDVPPRSLRPSARPDRPEWSLATPLGRIATSLLTLATRWLA